MQLDHMDTGCATTLEHGQMCGWHAGRSQAGATLHHAFKHSGIWQGSLDKAVEFSNYVTLMNDDDSHRRDVARRCWTKIKDLDMQLFGE